MRSNPLALCALLLSTALGSSGILSCASPPVSTMGYPRAAEIDVRGKNEVAVIGFNRHRNGSAVRTKLQEKLGETEQFKIVAPGRASLHLKGKVEESYKRKGSDSRRATCVASEKYKDEDGKTAYRKREYSCTEHIKQAEVRVALQMEVVNAKNKDTLVSKRPICEKEEQTTSLYDPDLEVDSWFGVVGEMAEMLGGDTVTEIKSRQSAPEIDENAMFEGCLDEVGDTAIRTIARWTENVSLTLKEDSSVPEFKRAQELADRGEWGDVLEIYESVSKNPGLSPKSRVRAYFNLGKVQMYHAKDFSGAMSSFEKGMESARSGGKEDCSEKTPRKNCFVSRINEAKWRAEDWKKLQRQRRSGQ
ncbi:MAG: hypothetical protein OXU53_04995 [Deltaproteobacteria bacterium]|nr:hypothetical protein [Deltaproteobacteria bacterium]